jgi:DNA mismatch endonuclease (patch repair protein)
MRYRVDGLTIPPRRRRADIVFVSCRVAVFVDGCFWHGCPEHGVVPKRHSEWWLEKLGATRARDRDTDARLDAAGWVSIRVWEHDDPHEAALAVAKVVRARRARSRGGSL